MTVLVKARDRWEGRIHLIQRICSEESGVTLLEILSDRRTRKVIVVRHIAMMLARNLTPSSFPVIGRMFRRDHSSVMTGIKRAEKLITEKESVKSLALKCQQRFEASEKADTTEQGVE